MRNPDGPDGDRASRAEPPCIDSHLQASMQGRIAVNEGIIRDVDEHILNIDYIITRVHAFEIQIRLRDLEIIRSIT